MNYGITLSWVHASCAFDIISSHCADSAEPFWLASFRYFVGRKYAKGIQKSFHWSHTLLKPTTKNLSCHGVISSILGLYADTCRGHEVSWIKILYPCICKGHWWRTWVTPTSKSFFLKRFFCLLDVKDAQLSKCMSTHRCHRCLLWHSRSQRILTIMTSPSCPQWAFAASWKRCHWLK